jgi:hypothetical protein
MRTRRILLPLAVVAGSAVAFGALIAAVPQGPPEGGPPGGPPGGFGGPQGPGGPGFGPGTFLAPRIIELADSDEDGQLSPKEAAAAARRLIRSADTKKEGSIDARSIGRVINREIGPPPGFGPGGPPDGPSGGGPPGGPPGGDPPNGFGPGTFLGPQIAEAADKDKDGRVSPDEAATLAETFVREADTDEKGSIDAETLGRALNRRIGPPPGFGPGGPMGQERKIVKTFDKDGDGRLNQEERRAARASLKKDREKGGARGRGGFGRMGGPPGFGPPGGGPGGGPGRPPGFGREEEPVKPGLHVDAADVPAVRGKGLYDPDVLRTLFLQFEEKDWEAALEEFHGTDVELPADLTVDGRTYRGVGVHFRGMSSYMGVSAGHKRSLNVSIDFTDDDLRLEGYKTLNLLNSHEDLTFLHTVLYSRIARSYIPAPKANFVSVVVNGESWGVYVNAQQFDKIFLAENYPSSDGARWKVRGNPGGDGGLRSLGDDVEEYKKRFEMKSGDKKDWAALVALCKTLERTPPEKLEAALKPILDIDGALWFLAIDNALVNGDGYWTRASDYSLFRDKQGKFHVIPHDMNEAFGPAMGPGFGPGGRRGGPGGAIGKRGGPAEGAIGKRGSPPGGPGGRPGGSPRGGGVDLDPLIGLDNERTPLRGKLLAVPSLRARYLEHVRTIAEDWLDWKKLGLVVADYRTLIERAVEEDTRKLSSVAAFRETVADSVATGSAPMRGRMGMALRTFADQRRKYLLGYRDEKAGQP